MKTSTTKKPNSEASSTARMDHRNALQQPVPTHDTFEVHLQQNLRETRRVCPPGHLSPTPRAWVITAKMKAVTTKKP